MVVEEVEEPPVEEALLLELGEVALVVVADAEVARDHAAADRTLVQFRWNHRRGMVLDFYHKSSSSTKHAFFQPEGLNTLRTINHFNSSQAISISLLIFIYSIFYILDFFKACLFIKICEPPCIAFFLLNEVKRA